ncbi:hypothetical protein ROS1_60050 [Roseibium sp. ROS1]
MRNRIAFAISMTVSVLFLTAVNVVGCAAEESTGIFGVWLTIDASDEEGRKQGGIVFRSDNTGMFFDAVYRSEIQAENAEEKQLIEDMLNGLGFPNKGVVDVAFEYTLEDQFVIIQPKTFRGIDIDTEPARWAYELQTKSLRLTASQGDNRWILLERAE